MEPYWESDLGTLYHADVADALNEFADRGEEFELAFADPPYNIGKADWDEFESREAYLDWVVDWTRRVGDLLAADGTMYLTGMPEILAHVKTRLDRECDWIDSMRWLVWHYRNKPQMQDTGWTRSHEGVLWLRKGGDYKFRMDRVRIPYNSHTERYPMREQGQSSLFGSEDDYQWEPTVEGAKPRDVIDIPTVNNAASERTDHPTQKPEELLRRFIWASSDRGDCVLDPFGGSGTTYAACEQLGREWRGCEVSEEYCEMIADRLDDIDHREEPDHWMEHDLDRRQNRRKMRYGED